MAGQLYDPKMSEDEFVQACENALLEHSTQPRMSEAAKESWREYYREVKDEEAAAAMPQHAIYSDPWISRGNSFRVNRYFWRDNRKVYVNDTMRNKLGVYVDVGNRRFSDAYNMQEGN